MKKMLIAATVAATLASFSTQAANQGQGVVNFKGVVINAPCGIAPESVDQTIDFGQISKSHLEAGGISVQKNVDIKLINCDIAQINNGVTVTFTGNIVNGTADELNTAGNTGTAVVINGYNKNVTYGQAFDAIKLQADNNTLHFTSWVKKATGAPAVAEGAFSATANFSLAYN
ncbi:TPA: type 1 fimbrial protein [Escherichia coli]|uniref:fimbrial protein n=1 Tax=Escherichia coli TaxID=562 RepID=UPI00038F6FFA|nr:fimbrial protein [Escherichia coli]EEZ9318123.1 type 1 fimbrial protein [Escherichia coli]EFC6562040.1 type 1 fimbrial protein [Escherichia coli]EFH7069613.1 fimbrial protein [Escherichia coli]EHW3053357.1 type 1 fimbrial protein [Escherichia coli]EHX8223920.1 type 1 fimbrial protein [Escherichia coli]